MVQNLFFFRNIWTESALIHKVWSFTKYDEEKNLFSYTFSALEYSSLTNLSILKCWSYQQLVEDRAEVILRGQTCTQVWGPQLDSGPSVCLTSEVSFPSARRVPAPLLSAAHSFTLAASPQRTASSPALYTLSETLCVWERQQLSWALS